MKKLKLLAVAGFAASSLASATAITGATADLMVATMEAAQVSVAACPTAYLAHRTVAYTCGRHALTSEATVRRWDAALMPEATSRVLALDDFVTYRTVPDSSAGWKVNGSIWNRYYTYGGGPMLVWVSDGWLYVAVSQGHMEAQNDLATRRSTGSKGP